MIAEHKALLHGIKWRTSILAARKASPVEAVVKKIMQFRLGTLNVKAPTQMAIKREKIALMDTKFDDGIGIITEYAAHVPGRKTKTCRKNVARLKNEVHDKFVRQRIVAPGSFWCVEDRSMFYFGSIKKPCARVGVSRFQQ